MVLSIFSPQIAILDKNFNVKKSFIINNAKKNKTIYFIIPNNKKKLNFLNQKMLNSFIHLLKKKFRF